MKKILILLGTTAIVILAVIGCKKFEDKSLDRGVGVVLSLSNLTPSSPLFVDVEKDSVSFEVSLAKGDKVDNAAIKVTYQGKSAIVKQITFPVSDTVNVKILGSDILKALNITKESVGIGTSFQIDVTSTLNGLTTVSPASFYIQIPCAYDASLTLGNYEMVSASWNVDASVKLVVDKKSPNVFYISGLAEADALVSNGNLMKITVDTVNFTVAGENTIIAADCSPWGADYAADTNYKYGVVSGTFNSCDGSYQITFDISSDIEDFGTYAFTFTRK